MTLATHIVIAAAATKPFAAAHPVLGFLAALATHYLADAIPHWDYPIGSAPRDPATGEVKKIFERQAFLEDLRNAAIDFAAGSAVFILVRPPADAADALAIAGVIAGAVLPDALQGLYLAKKWKWLAAIQRFHDWSHTKIRLGPFPLIGIPFQLLIAGAAFFILL